MYLKNLLAQCTLCCTLYSMLDTNLLDIFISQDARVSCVLWTLPLVKPHQLPCELVKMGLDTNPTLPNTQRYKLKLIIITDHAVENPCPFCSSIL